MVMAKESTGNIAPSFRNAGSPGLGWSVPLADKAINQDGQFG